MNKMCNMWFNRNSCLPWIKTSFNHVTHKYDLQKICHRFEELFLNLETHDLFKMLLYSSQK